MKQRKGELQLHVLCCSMLCVRTYLGCPIRARSEQVGVTYGPLHVVYDTMMGVCLERRRGDVEEEERKSEKMPREKKKRR